MYAGDLKETASFGDDREVCTVTMRVVAHGYDTVGFSRPVSRRRECSNIRQDANGTEDLDLPDLFPKIRFLEIDTLPVSEI